VGESGDPLSSLSPEQRAAFELLLRRRRGGARAPETAAIPRRADPAAHPLSFAQQRLWLVDQLAPGDPAYNIHGAVRLCGALDAPALARALSAIAARHEPLRSRFVAVEGEPVQLVEPAGEVPLPWIDTGALPPARGEAEILRLAVEEARRPFDLARGPLLRAALLRAAPADHVLLLTIHHIAADGWSISILLRELAALYAACAAGRPSPLAPLPLAYADYAAWQRELLRGERLAREVEHWRERLAGLPELRLIPEHPAAAESSRGGSVPFVLSPEVAVRLQSLARGAGASLFMVLLAAFQLLLARWTGERDLAVGAPVAHRLRPEVEGLIGFFVNTLVLRAHLAGDPSFLDLLERTERTVVDALAHQELPFEKLVEELQPGRRLGQTPFFVAALAFQSLPPGAAVLPGLTITRLPVRNGTARFDLTVALDDEGGRIAGGVEFRAVVLSPQTAERLAGHFLVLLTAIGEDPRHPVFDLPLLSAAERAQILDAWSGREHAAPVGEETFPVLFEAQVDRTPDAPAVVAAGRTLTYRELDRRANRIARRLRHLGVGRESRIALRLERSPDLLAALVAVWKAGGAAVPIGLATPPERLAGLRGDAAPTVELTAAELSDPALDGESEERPGGRVLPAQLAYLIYTSGSTGQPKGVMIPHSALAAFHRAFAEALGPRDGGDGRALRIGLNAPLAFDASLQAVVQLLLGHCVWIVPEEARRDPDRLADFLAAADLDALDCTPTQLDLVLTACEASGRPPAQLWVGGEPIPPPLWRRLATHPQIRCWNVYGPTEHTINATARVIGGPRAAEGPDLGHPLPGVHLWLLDAAGLPVPAGATGEICLGGPQAGRGYFRRPDLTAERFRPDPFAGEPGARLYRTGDLARFRADGRVELFGRTDEQVKIRGHRIELGEIEAQLLAHPEVREAAAGVRADAQGNRRLVAWIAASPDTDLRALRVWLARHLPEVMLPSAFVRLDDLPRLQSGKLARRALPFPGPAAAGAAAGSLEPVTSADAIEAALLDLFREVLGVERVGPTDNFFELGGHSMSAYRLAARVREIFGRRLAVRDLFLTPTPAGLAQVLRSKEKEGSRLPPILPAPRGRPLPLALAQQRLWLLHQLTPGLTTYHIPAVLRLRGRLDVPALHGALTGILHRHEALRTHFPLQEGEPVQEIDPPREAALPVVDLAGVGAIGGDAWKVEACRAVRAAALTPFDLAHGPLLRLLLVRLGAEDHLFTVVVHHLVSDGWSAAIFLRELAALYAAAVRGEPSPLPAPRVQYADWAVWQREELSGEVVEEHLDWWRERLAGAPRHLDLPTDRPRPRLEDPAGAGTSVHLPVPVVDELRRLALGEEATLYMALLAGFQALLARWTGEEILSVGSPVARRHRLEVEGLIGFFVNTVVICTDLTGDPTGRELIGRVRDAVFGAFAHQDLPFERLVEALDAQREPGWSPLFQVSFALQNVPREEPRLPGLEVELLETDTGTAHFDLAAALVETGAGATGTLRYRTALFDSSTVRRLAGHWETLLRAIAAEPDRPLSALSFLTPAERHQITVEWAGPERTLPNRTLPEMLAEQAARTPRNIAVVCGATSLTYEDLDRRSEELAQWLRTQGAGPETAVAISLERSIEMVVGLLGILRTGAAYLPIDPGNPRERQAFLREDAGAKVLLSRDSPSPGPSPAERERGTPALAPGSSGWVGAPSPAPRGRDGEGGEGATLQALLYTSGSTGRPKATALPARGLLNLCLWHRDASPVLPHTRSLLGFSFSFDAAFKHLIVPLLVGGRVVLAPPGPFDAGEMLETIRRDGVNFFATTSSQMAAILQRAAQDSFRDLETLETVIVGGEATPWADFRPWLASGRCRAEILHTYGPSEASDTVACHRATPEEIATADRLPVGRPADNLRMLVVDAGLLPLPIGVPGELCLGGIGLARGYFGRPALTAEKFVPDPLHPGERLYRTGDLARWRRDGEVEILGRIDHQVKIRGIRVEPPEIEAALMTHPAVGAALVGARESAVGEKRLIAWLVPAEGTELPPASVLREHLRERLPEALIPAAFVPLDAFPLTARGKLDRNALPDPEAPPAEVTVPPRDALELQLAGLFREVLGGEVGVHDSFFERGGHSLAAVRLASRIREVLGIALPVAALFAAPTVEALARLLREDGRLATTPLVSLRTGGEGAPLFLIHPGGGTVFGYLELVRRLPPGFPVYGLQAPGLEPGEEPLRTVEALAERYLPEIRRAQPQGPRYLAGWSFGGLIAFELARRLRGEGAEIASLTLIDPTDPKGLETLDETALREAFTQEQGRLPAEVSPDDLHRRFAVFQASLEAARAYNPGAYDGPLDLLEAAERPKPAPTWRARATRTLVLPGNHHTLLEPPQVEALVAAWASPRA